MSQPTISILAELPESVHAALLAFVERNKTWDQDAAIAAALSAFLTSKAAPERAA